MKKFVLAIGLLMITVALSAQVQPVPMGQGQGTEKFEQQGPSDNGVSPGGIPVWTQLPVCGSWIWSSQFDPGGALNSRVADDFILDATYTISEVKWWSGFWNLGYIQPIGFNIFIFDDLNCMPNNLIQQWNIPYPLAHEAFICYPGNYPEYWATLTPAFNAVQGVHYWLVIQVINPFQPQSGWVITDHVTLCEGMESFPMPANPWVPISQYGEGPFDMAFILYAQQAVPLSGWALAIGIILIATFAFIRYRRIS